MMKKMLAFVLLLLFMLNLTAVSTVVSVEAKTTEGLPETLEIPSKERVRELVDQFYERNNSKSKLRNANMPLDLETIEVDNRDIIHIPADSLPIPELVLGNGIAPFQLITEQYSGPFLEGNERYFRIMVDAATEDEKEAYRAVKARVVAQGGNSNVWVLDDMDFHAKTNSEHSDTNCTLSQVTYAQAKELATGFDGIYQRMTDPSTGFAEHRLYEAAYTNMQYFGDLGDDGKVNILLYDIDSSASGDGGYIAGYFSAGDMFSAEPFGDGEMIYPIDMFHVDIGVGVNQGWEKLNGDAQDKLSIYGTLAHEFQHMLFFEHFGAYRMSGDYSWINEALSGLADMYYVQPGAELISLGRTAYAASNPYLGSGYGDFFQFNNSLKNYGMGYLFSALYHNMMRGTYAHNLYQFLTTGGMANEDGTVDSFYNKFNYFNSNTKFGATEKDYPNALLVAGAMLKKGLQYPENTGYDLSLLTAYWTFMENFISDGGFIANANPYESYLSYKPLRSTQKEHNLWDLRPRLGIGGLASITGIPTLQNGENIILNGWQNSKGYSATHDMLYKLALDSKTEAISITINDWNNPNEHFARYYLAVPNDNAAAGADVYELVPNESGLFRTNGKPAYLFAFTFFTSITDASNVTVNYTGSDIPSEYLKGKVSVDNATPRIGDTLTASYSADDINPSYSWYRDDDFGSAISEVSSYTVDVNDLNHSLIIDVMAGDSQGDRVSTLTARVAKALYSGDSPSAPTSSNVTYNQVSLGNKGSLYEYSNGGAVWQDSPIFSGLAPSTSYQFYQRVKETATVEASASSPALSVVTTTFNPEVPKLTEQPQDIVHYNQEGNVNLNLSVAASITDAGTLSYQWYRNTSNQTSGSPIVSSANKATYTLPVDTAGTYYYYCIVTNTNQGATATATSNVAKVELKKNLALDKESYSYGDSVVLRFESSNTYVGTTVDFYCGDTKLNEDPVVYSSGAEFSYDTTKKGIPIGTQTITAKRMLNQEVKQSATAKIEMKQKDLHITANDLEIYAGAVPSFTAALSGTVSGEAVTNVQFACSYTTKSPAGTYSIIPTGCTILGSEANYNRIYTAGTLTVKEISNENNKDQGVNGTDNEPKVTPSGSAEDNKTEGNSKKNEDNGTKETNKTSITFSEDTITNAIKKAEENAKEGKGFAITLAVAMKEDDPSLEVKFSEKMVADLITAGITELTIQNGLANVTLDAATLKTLEGGEMVLSIEKVDPKTLSKEAKEIVKDRPIFEFKLTSNGNPITYFNGGKVRLEILYDKPKAEQIGNLCAFYIEEDGMVSWIPSSGYDEQTNTMLLSTPHFSMYGIGYKKNQTALVDTKKHWAKNDIDFVMARELFILSDATMFKPKKAITRSEFVTALGRLAKVDTTKYQNKKFTDITADYAPYVTWAVRTKIIKGTSPTKFSPNKSITREEMAVMLVAYSRVTGYTLPDVHDKIKFTDAKNISKNAKTAVKQTQKSGLFIGKKKGKFAPKSAATRAETCAILRRYIELTISAETAEGWAMNESGQWLYIKNGKRLKSKGGTAIIDGKSYQFNKYGIAVRQNNIK